MDKVPWDKVILREFLSIAFVTDEEEQILRTRIAGWSQVKQCHKLHMSLATLNRRIRKLKDKYISAQKHSKILPKNLDF